MIRKIFKITAGVIAALLTLIIAFYFIGKVYFYKIPVLMYHHVKKSENYESFTVSPENFSKQLNFIKTFGYNVITLKEYIKRKKTDKEFVKKNLVLLTFNGGYRNHYKNVYKKLLNRKMKGTFFIPVNKIGEKNRLTETQILKMKHNGMEFGSLTLNGYYLPYLSYNQMKKEISKSKSKLENLVNEEVNSIAYCAGGYNQKILDLVKKAGYEIAFTTNRSFEKNLKDDNIYQIRRIKVTNEDDGFKLWMKLTGLF